MKLNRAENKEHIVIDVVLLKKRRIQEKYVFQVKIFDKQINLH